jgi:hypothetical protein
MTEADWWAATNFEDLMGWLSKDRRAHRRKLCLLGVSCAGRAGHLLGELGVNLLRSCESYIDGQVSEHDLRETWLAARAWRDANIARWSAARNAWDAVVGPTINLPTIVHDWYSFAWYACDASAEALHPDDFEPDPELANTEFATEPWVIALKPGATGYPGERLSQLRLLHDIFGPLPFREVAIPPEWSTSTVVALARGIYDEKAFDRIPILADALQDAGCDNDEILSHCRRENWEHVRGCWAIDLLLGRPWRE